MTDIDWLAVEHVCDGYPMKLNHDEQKAAIRRMAHRINPVGEWDCTGRYITYAEVGRRLKVDERTVHRRKRELPPAVKQFCPVCRKDCWVTATHVEPHAADLFRTCPMSGRETLSGLASVRPDLYRWAWSA